MKKLFIALLAMAATVNAMAIEISAKATLTLSSAKGEACTMKLFQTSDAKADKYCAPINMSGRVVALYSIANSKNYQDFYTADLEGVVLGLLTNEETNFNISFSNIEGKLYLVDAVEDKFIEITEGGSYAFTAEANQTIADRFSISKYLPYLFVDGVVTIGELKDGESIYFQYFTYVDGKRVNGPVAGNTNRNKSFEPYTTEGYCEIWYTNKAGVERKFIVNPAPVVTPAN